MKAKLLEIAALLSLVAASSPLGCGGKSIRHFDDDGGGAEPTGGGTGVGGANSFGGATGAAPSGGREPAGGVGATGGVSVTGGVGTGASGGVVVTGGSPSGGTSGNFEPVCGDDPGFGVYRGAPDYPVLIDTYHWDCRDIMTSCLRVTLGGCLVTATRTFEDCPSDGSFPSRPEECAAHERWLCHLAWSPQGRPMLVNCECEPKPVEGCGPCTSLLTGFQGPPLACDDQVKICGCAE